MKTPHLPIFSVPRMPAIARPRLPGFRNPLTATFPWIAWLTWIVLVFYLFFCGVLLWTCTLPATAGESEIRLGADSATYWELVHAFSSGAEVVLLSFTGNLLGPVMLGVLLKTALAVACFNLALFLVSIGIARSIPGVNYCIFTILLMLNAETAVSIVSLNKEIFTIISLVLLAKYIHSERKSKILLLVILAISLLARWEQSLIVIVFLLLQRGRFKQHPWFSLSLVIGGITVVYPLMLHSSSVDLSAFSNQAEGGGLIVLFNSIQNHFGFFLVLIPKIFMSIAGRLATPWYFAGGYWDQDALDLQNRFAVHLHEIAIVLLFLWVLLKRKFTLDRPIVFFIVLYLVITSVNPFIQPRYQYPVYVLLCLVASTRDLRSTRRWIRGTEEGATQPPRPEPPELTSP